MIWELLKHTDAVVLESIKVSWNGLSVHPELRVTALEEALHRKENLGGNERCHHICTEIPQMVLLSELMLLAISCVISSTEDKSVLESDYLTAS